MRRTDEPIILLLRQLNADTAVDEEWSLLDCLVGNWTERHRRRTELVTLKDSSPS